LYNLYQSITSTSTIGSGHVLNASFKLTANPVSENLMYFVENKESTKAQISLLDPNEQTVFPKQLNFVRSTE